MNKTIGILAHVDAGKTTLAEQILYNTNTIHSLGSVDHKDSFLDINEIERQRGITIFADQAIFSYQNSTYFLIDTPGHVDFSAETERAIAVLDYAILVINGTSGVEAHTTTLFRLLQKYHIPIFFFVNKMDYETADFDQVNEEICKKLSCNTFPLHDIHELDWMTSKQIEQLAELDDSLLNDYLEDNLNPVLCMHSLIHSIQTLRCYPILKGSALKNQNVSEFFEIFDTLTVTNYKENSPFLGLVYKIRHDEHGNRITFIKILSGHLAVKDEIHFPKEEHSSDKEERSEKINEIRFYNGAKYNIKKVATAGELCAVTGLSIPICGSTIGSIYKQNFYELQPALTSKVTILDQTDIKTVWSYLQQLQAEDPMLKVSYHNALKELHVQIMGQIQLEVLKHSLESRFSLSVDFHSPKAFYMETIQKPIMGYGHFEPLRHYAEVNLRLEPGKLGSGITFSSECHVDTLAIQYQNLIKTHILEKTHCGILTGFPLTDVHIVLIDGKAHQKHTEGGDFREATYRAIRQGLEKAQNILLEPMYHFEINSPVSFLGKILSDITKRHGCFEVPQQDGDFASILGVVPVSSFLDYPLTLTSITNGTATIYLESYGYSVCHNAEEVITSIDYQKDSDLDNPSSSVFCAKGKSFLVPWDKAEGYMHCI